MNKTFWMVSSTNFNGCGNASIETEVMDDSVKN